MTRKHRVDLCSSLLVGIGIIASTLIAMQAAESGWFVMTGALFLALTFVSADVLDSRLRGERSAPSRGVLLLAATFLLAGLMVTLRDPALVKTLIPVIGSAAWITILLRSDARKSCRHI